MRILSFAVCSVLLSISIAASAADYWKGSPKSQRYQVGALNGLGASGNHSGYTLLGTAAFLVHEPGIIEDVTEQMWLEIQGGPFFVSGGTGSLFNTILRWDFTYDESWVFYGFGGLTSFFRPSIMGSGFDMHLHFGVGARYYVYENVFVRADASYSAIGFGFGIPF